MTLNLIKLCVGIENVDHLARAQRARLAAQRDAGETPRLRHVTRMWPKQRDDLLPDGSLYWVIKGMIRCRQRLLGFDEVERADGKPACGLVLDPEIVLTAPRAHRAFQGWRYFDAKDAPPDLTAAGAAGADLPPEMAEELRALGLI